MIYYIFSELLSNGGIDSYIDILVAILIILLAKKFYVAIKAVKQHHAQDQSAKDYQERLLIEEEVKAELETINAKIKMEEINYDTKYWR